MNTIKVTVQFTLPGRTLSNENSELLGVKLQDPKTKKFYYKNIELRSPKPASKEVKWTLQQYQFMTSAQGKPAHIYAGKWAQMNKKERLNTLIEEMAQDMGALYYTFSILD